MSATPGPWEVTPYGNRAFEIQGANGVVVGRVTFDGSWSSQHRYDLMLIAKAPELAAAIRKAHLQITKGDHDGALDTLAVMLDAAG